MNYQYFLSSIKNLFRKKKVISMHAFHEQVIKIAINNNPTDKNPLVVTSCEKNHFLGHGATYSFRASISTLKGCDAAIGDTPQDTLQKLKQILNPKEKESQILDVII
jgi:hypothetical protein